MHDMLGALANVATYGVEGASERANDADEAYAAGEAAVAALGEVAPGPDLASALLETGALPMSTKSRIELLDPATGKPVDLGDASYELSAQMRRWLDARDRSCRFPGCAARAVHCDADHSVEWPVGETTCANCGLLCRRHHNFKTSKAWRLTRNVDDSVDWHSPFGFDWHVEAATYEDFLDTGPPGEQAA